MGKKRTSQLLQIAIAAFIALIIYSVLNRAEAQSIDQVQANKSSGNSYNAGSGNVKATAKQQQQQAQQMEQFIVVNASSGLESFGANGTPLSTASGGSLEFTSIIPDNTPNIGGSSIYPSNPCHMVFNAGVSLPGFGANGGKTYIDQECSARELARMFYGFGARDIAFHILCEQEDAKGIPGCGGVQDYNKEMAMVRTDNDEFQRQYQEQRGTIEDLTKTNAHLLEQLREERMRRSLAK